MGRSRGLSLPLFRLGILVIVGSLAASVVEFYRGVGMQIADMNGPDVATGKHDLWVHFRDHFLFAGGTAGVLFWVGIALCGVGIIRMKSSRGDRGGRGED